MNKKFLFKNKSILVTGGTGSFGRAFTKYVINKKLGLKKLIIFSRDELKQFEMNKVFCDTKHKFIRYFIGDIRDKDRLKLALKDVDIVVHAAALKQVPAAEYNPIEFIKTNVFGSQNVIETSMESGVKKVIALSTDKASSPINLYGATKLCADKLFLSANNIKGSNKITFTVVRYGNVMGSRGSVLHSFNEQKKKKIISITDKKMTRFNITIEHGVKLVFEALVNGKGGEIFVPKIPSFYITDLAKAISPESKIKIIGIRPGEKIHEEMISVYDSPRTIEKKNYYLILSDYGLKKYNSKNFLKNNFIYRSDTNSHFLNVKDLKKIIKQI
jgi:UDP-N-acetylglucosamine 4,6-dehydratase/5-epimerase